MPAESPATSLTESGFLVKEKIWRSNFYINLPLFMLLKGDATPVQPAPPIITRRPDHVYIFDLIR
jgi:hypothetical protein